MSDEDESYAALHALGDGFDLATFEQLLDMDDDDEREFSKEIVFGFIDQAERTFGEMADKLKMKDLKSLSDLGHYLKGSSATLGLVYVKNSCEKIQHWGHKKDETGVADQLPELCLQNIEAELGKMRRDFSKAKIKLEKFYGV